MIDVLFFLTGSDHPGKPIVIAYIRPGGVADK